MDPRLIEPMRQDRDAFVDPTVSDRSRPYGSDGFDAQRVTCSIAELVVIDHERLRRG